MLGSVDAMITIAVSDIEKAKTFYQDVLGLTLVNQGQEGVFFKSGSTVIMVYSSEFAGSNKATYASWMVDDIEAIVSDLSSKEVHFEHYDNIPGATLNGDIHSMGSMKAAWFTDPDGNILNITSGTLSS